MQQTRRACERWRTGIAGIGGLKQMSRRMDTYVRVVTGERGQSANRDADSRRDQHWREREQPKARTLLSLNPAHGNSRTTRNPVRVVRYPSISRLAICRLVGELIKEPPLTT